MTNIQGLLLRVDNLGYIYNLANACEHYWMQSKEINREYVYSVAAYQKYLTRLGESIIFEPWRGNYHFSQSSWIFATTLCTYSIYLLTFDLLSFIISNTDKHEFSSIWKWISCCNDVMNHDDCVIKRDVYRQKVHSCSKNFRWISFSVLKISVIYKRKYTTGDIAWIFA